MSAFVSFDQLSKSYGDLKVVSEFNLEIERGQFVALVGPSGCGKSTVLRMTAGLESISSGTVSVDGRVINLAEPRDRDIAMVFQNYALYPDKTVFDNMAFGLRMRSTPRDEIERRVKSAASILQIEALLERRPAQLSGGQRQRVAVGRVIVRDPKVFLFDEPLSNLDAHLRGSMRKELIQLHKRLQATMIYVTHDQIEAMTMGDVIVVMRDGRIQQHGAPLEVFNRPNNVFVASFIGAPPMNMVKTELAVTGENLALRFGQNQLLMPAPLRSVLGGHGSSTVIFGIRPHDVSLDDPSSGKTGIPGVIQLVERLGTETLVDVECDGFVLQVRLGPVDPVEIGQTVVAVPDLSRAHFFDVETQSAICHGGDLV